MEDLFNQVIDTVKGVADDATKDAQVWIADRTADAQKVADSIMDDRSRDWELPVEQSASLLDNIKDEVDKFVDDPVEYAKGVIDNVSDKVSGFVDRAIGNGQSTANSVDKDDADYLADIARYGQEVADQTVRDAEDEYSSRVNQTVKEAKDAANKAAQAIVNANKGNLDTSRGLTPGVPDPLLDILGNIAPGLSSFLTPLNNNIAQMSGLADRLTEILPDKEKRETFGKLIDQLKDGIDRISGVDWKNVDSVSQALDKGLMTFLALVGTLVGSPFGLVPPFMDAYTNSVGEIVRGHARMAFKPGVVDANTAALALRRRMIKTEDATQAASWNGFNTEQFGILYQLTRQFLTIGDILQLWLRGEIKEPDADAYLTQLGLDDVDKDGVKKLALQIPNVQDLIHMAVREVFTPEIAQKFGQYEDYPPELTKYARMIGLSEEWARRFWAGHWELPSIQMGFEMLHRRVIDEATLNQLLRALDVMPFWRDKLTAISYQPLTRVDVRRMHKLGVLNNEETNLAYRDLGYDKTNAQRMTRFTILYNKEEEKIEKSVERDLTRTDLVNAYLDGMIDSSFLRLELMQSGYDAAEAELVIARADFKQAAKIRAKQMEIIKNRVMYRKIDLNAARDLMNNIGATEFEIRYHMTDLQLDMELAQFKEEAKLAK